MSVIFKCKMCGGDLMLEQNSNIATCEYCGTTQTVPTMDDDKKIVLFERAERLRKNCEFDKAAGVYESIVADFRQEAEAYWGLVLCKYGIEYVDDPATGKKVPTCHRSSFESVLDDPNFELTLENADPTALQVYRREAKQIEELRKGIIEASNKEEPYDVFICYKETDAAGDRTVDSLIGQDIYDALTDKGYRVFFARITLEDKLGEAYEPCIFAALNSAKVMLAVGTAYEHYNAVWVKNEWSRYLKLMEKDNDKYLIPCFKDIDAYDMPKEFKHLQAQDMGKVGAIQDLIRGISKMIPQEKEQVQQTIVVQQTGLGNVEILLKRGYMALEDKSWSKADEFFEDALNQNPECAEAYLGKFLAKQEVADLNSWVRKYLNMTLHAKEESCQDLTPNAEHIAEAVNQYAIEGYVDKRKIRELYQQFDLTYASELNDRIHQRTMLDRFWERSMELIRAERFAMGETAENLHDAKEQLVDNLDRRISQAEQKKQAAREQKLADYEAHLAKVDEQVIQVYEEGQSRREQEYQRLQAAKTEQTPDKLEKYAAAFDQLRDYKDSQKLAKWCRERRNQIIEENRRAQEEEQRKKEAKQKAFWEYQADCQKRNRKLSQVFLILAAVFFAVGIICLTISMGKTETDGEPMPIVAAVIASAIVELMTTGLLVLFTTKAAKFTEKIVGSKNRWVIPSRIFAIIGMVTTPILFLSQIAQGVGLGELGVWSLSVFAMHLTAFIVPFFRKKL